MIKRTIYIENEVYCFVKDKQFYLEFKSETKIPLKERIAHIPIEDIGLIVLDNPQIKCSMNLFSALFEANVGVIFCNSKHIPVGISQSFTGNHLHQAISEAQLSASEPLKKQLWQQTIKAKITNQASFIAKKSSEDPAHLLRLAKNVKTGDNGNLEGRAAKVYWKYAFQKELNFKRSPQGDPPNQLLNYGYSILRSLTIKSIVGAGLLPVIGLFHRNQYNPYCLADDLMEPYRVYVDEIVREIINDGLDFTEMNKELKVRLVQVTNCDVKIGGLNRPLAIALQQTSTSLTKCFLGKARKIVYPIF